MRRNKRFVALVGILALVGTACSGGQGSSDTTVADTLPGGTAPAPNAQLAASALVQLDSCDAFLDYVISHALELVGPYGFEIGGWGWMARDGVIMEEAAAADDGAEPSGGSEFSQTNVQVEGVDEPDIVKTDGERIVLMSEGTLIVVDVTGEQPREVGRLRMPDASTQSLFLSGDTVLAFGSSWVAGPMPFVAEDIAIGPVQGTSTVLLTEVDISGEPEIVRTMEIDGAFISGRMTADSVRMVLTSSPVGFQWEYPEGNGLRAEREATEKNRDIVRNSTVENWIPYYVITDAEGNVESEGTLFDCDRATHPEEFSGIDMLSVLTVDAENGLEVSDATGVLATGDTIYASSESLYVATQNWNSWRWLTTGDESDRPDGPTTEIHKFDTSDGRTDYVSSGSVEGYLLNQFSMDEHEGMLRVASTTDPNGWGGGTDSESRVTILRDVNGELIPIGLVSGLGETERIYSVRFMGDVGYVVTFRQTDPLYTIDLSNPRSPRVLGELKIPGYSAYLHPAGDGLLLGVGQDATDDGRIQGTQVSLFDVTEPGDPVRLDTYTLSEGTNSQVEYDHHAFLLWEDLAVVPVQRYWWDDEKDSIFMGAIAIEIDDERLVEVAELVHPGGDESDWDWRAQILRSVVIDDALYTISAKGIMKSPLDDLESAEWAGFDN